MKSDEIKQCLEMSLSEGSVGKRKAPASKRYMNPLDNGARATLSP
jgi:hypothetical protein